MTTPELKFVFWNYIHAGLHSESPMNQSNSVKTLRPNLDLQILITLSSLITVGIFIAIIKLQLQVEVYFPNTADFFDARKWIFFLRENTLPIFLAVSAGFWLYFWRRAYTKEHDLLLRLFPRGRTPSEFSNFSTFFMSLGLMIVFNCSFLLLCYFITSPTHYCIFMLVILGVDLISSYLTRDNLRQYMDSAKHKPSEQDEYKEFIYRRRQIAMRYVYLRPHAWRTAGLIFIVITAIALQVTFDLTQQMQSIATAAAAASVVFANEILISAWRRRRDQEWHKVDVDELAHDLAKYGST
jgi:hypothetical protein